MYDTFFSFFLNVECFSAKGNKIKELKKYVDWLVHPSYNPSDNKIKIFFPAALVQFN